MISPQFAHLNCPQNRVTYTECPTGDYLMVTCSLDGRVVEAYTPGISADPHGQKLNDRSELSNFLGILYAVSQVKGTVFQDRKGKMARFFLH